MKEQDNWVTVEFNGTRKSILREKLPEAQQMADEMKALAIKAGHSRQYAEEYFTLRIVTETSVVDSDGNPASVYHATNPSY